MLTENDVIAATARFLDAQGWRIVGTASTNQRGHDIDAERNGLRLLVEAKGATSSKAATARYGQAFTANQVNSHVSRAVLRAMRTVDTPNVRAALALPDNEHHRRELEAVAPALRRLDIAVLWVDASGNVRVEHSSI